jgi:NADPH:quinone reductase-like Zn-dependent oxidoreductase
MERTLKWKGSQENGTHRVDRRPLKEDWARLFKLLEEGQIEPIVAAKFPLLEAAKANELLESGQITGNVVLLAPELLWVCRSLNRPPQDPRK